MESVGIGFNAISIHTPRVGSDFNPLRRRINAGISIHTPRVGSDLWVSVKVHVHGDFNPHSPCGE